jgi:hypothetical protein
MVMNQRDLAVSEQKPRRPASVKRACDLLERGEAKTITDAAAMAGISREYLSRSLGKGHIQGYLNSRARRRLALGVLRAAATKVERDSLHVRNQASSDVLALAGFIVKDGVAPLVNLDLRQAPGYTIYLSSNEGRTVEVRPGVIEALPDSAPGGTL